MKENEKGDPYDQMSMGRRSHQVNSKPVILSLQHMESLAKAQIPQDVHGQIPKPITHALGRRPPLPVNCPQPAPDLLAKGANIGQDVPLHLLDGTITKGMRHDPSLPGMQLLVPAVVCVGRGMHEGIVEGGLCYIGPEAVDFFERGGGVEREGVGTETNNSACEVASVCVSTLEHISPLFP